MKKTKNAGMILLLLRISLLKITGLPVRSLKDIPTPDFNHVYDETIL